MDRAISIMCAVRPTFMKSTPGQFMCVSERERKRNEPRKFFSEEGKKGGLFFSEKGKKYLD